MPSATSTPLATQPVAKSPEAVRAEAEAQWIFTEAELAQAPSIVDGMSLETERELRAKGLNFILQVGIMLKMTQVMLSTAGVFFNRFLMRHSMQKTAENPKPLHHYQIAATSLFLATKTEENIRKLRDLIVSCCRVAQKNHTLVIDEQSKDYWRWRDTLLMNEDVLLEALCFDLTVESPYKLLFDMLKTLGLEHNKTLRNAAWSFVNDGGLTVICLLHTSRTIAAAALYCGAKYSQTELSGDSDAERNGATGTSSPKWWKQVGVELRDVQKACNFMADLYENNVTTKTGDPKMYVGLRTPLADEEEEEEEEQHHGSNNIHGEEGEVLEYAAEKNNDNGSRMENATPRSRASDGRMGGSTSPRGIKRGRDGQEVDTGNGDGDGDGNGSEEGELDE